MPWSESWLKAFKFFNVFLSVSWLSSNCLQKRGTSCMPPAAVRASLDEGCCRVGTSQLIRGIPHRLPAHKEPNLFDTPGE